jgi:hypothetical protein
LYHGAYEKHAISLRLLNVNGVVKDPPITWRLMALPDVLLKRTLYTEEFTSATPQLTQFSVPVLLIEPVPILVVIPLGKSILKYVFAGDPDGPVCRITNPNPAKIVPPLPTVKD